MDIGSFCRSRKNVGQWLRLMSVWALSLWPHRIWQEQSQAGVTASIHLLVSCNREGAFVQGHTHTNTHKLICTLQAVFSTQFSKQGCTHLCLCLSHSCTHTRIKKTENKQKERTVNCAHIYLSTHAHSEWLTEEKKPSWQASLCVFPGRSRFAVLSFFKCLRALMSYYGRQMACRTNSASQLVSSGHDNHRNTFHITVCALLLVKHLKQSDRTHVGIRHVITEIYAAYLRFQLINRQ